MVETLQSLAQQRLARQSPERLSPFAFPLWAESQRSQVSTESWGDRVKRMAQQLEKRAS